MRQPLLVIQNKTRILSLMSLLNDLICFSIKVYFLIRKHIKNCNVSLDSRGRLSLQIFYKTSLESHA